MLQPLYQAAHRGVLAAVARWNPAPGRMLDVGCGTGRLLAAAARRFPHTTIVGIDVSHAMLAAARVEYPAESRIQLVEAAVERLPFADRVFDLVTSTVSFRHWSHQPAGVREISRVLTHDGTLILADVFATRRRGVLARIARRAWPPPQLVKQACAAAGLNVVQVEQIDGFGPVSVITIVTARCRRQGA